MNVTILDGGIGHLLKERGVQTRVSGTPFEQSFLSSAYANEDAADAVRAMHGDYISAGADVLTANNFALTVGGTTHEHMLSSTHARCVGPGPKPDRDQSLQCSHGLWPGQVMGAAISISPRYSCAVIVLRLGFPPRLLAPSY